MITTLKRNNMVAQYCVKFIQSEHNAKQAKTVQLKYFEERKKKKWRDQKNFRNFANLHLEIQ